MGVADRWKRGDCRLVEALGGVAQEMGLWAVCFLYLRDVQSFVWSHKRAYRIYKIFRLCLRIKSRHGLKLAKLDKLAVPECSNLMWSGDFTTNQTKDGRMICFLCA